MQSKYAYFFALMSGALALIFVIGVNFYVQLVKLSTPYIGTYQFNIRKKNPDKIPNFITVTEGDELNIFETDDEGNSIQLIYSSNTKDQIADFNLFAVPQVNFNQVIYLETQQDQAGSMLIVYPLNLSTGSLSAATLNVPSHSAAVSLDQTRVAVINNTGTTAISAYEISTGQLLASWTLANNERFTETYSSKYTGIGAVWVNQNCFEHPVWLNALMEMRTFCVAAPTP
ncbi:MAG: hypothetical protein WAZ14_00920 [Patescibacteria group bacterium]